MSNANNASLIDVLAEVNVWREMGIYFKLVKRNGDEEYRVDIDNVPRAFPCLPAASQFRNDHLVELRLIMMSVTEAGEIDIDALRRIDFARWRVDNGDWGPFPSLRVIHFPRIKDEEILPDKD